VSGDVVSRDVRFCCRSSTVISGLSVSGATLEIATYRPFGEIRKSTYSECVARLLTRSPLRLIHARSSDGSVRPAYASTPVADAETAE
jgi:hypothetical protein